MLNVTDLHHIRKNLENVFKAEKMDYFQFLNVSKFKVLKVHQHQNFLSENQELLMLRLLLPLGKY